MTTGDVATVEAALDAAIALHQQVRRGDLAPVARAAQAIRQACETGGKILVFGNGGSAADAQHFVAELVGRFERQRPAFAAIALTADTSVLTSVANDETFERVFARQIEGLGRQGDVAVAITTSGESPNVLAGIQTAGRGGLRTIALTGRNGGRVGAAAEIHINVPDGSAAGVQEVHRTLIHAICRIVEGPSTSRQARGRPEPGRATTGSGQGPSTSSGQA